MRAKHVLLTLYFLIRHYYYALRYALYYYLILGSRYLWLRVRGYEAANYPWRYYGRQDHRQVEAMMREIFERARLPHFDVVLEHGCGDRKRTTPGLRAFAREIWGTDIFPKERIYGDDRYIEIDLQREDLLHEIPDHSIDAIVLINYTGMHPHSTWELYFSEHNDRLAPYMKPSNFPRVLRSPGYLICVEWEAAPEARWGKASVDEIDRRSNESYKPPHVEGYHLVASGFSKKGLCPFVIYGRG